MIPRGVVRSDARSRRASSQTETKMDIVAGCGTVPGTAGGRSVVAILRVLRKRQAIPARGSDHSAGGARGREVAGFYGSAPSRRPIVQHLLGFEFGFFFRRQAKDLHQIRTPRFDCLTKRVHNRLMRLSARAAEPRRPNTSRRSVTNPSCRAARTIVDATKGKAELRTQFLRAARCELIHPDDTKHSSQSRLQRAKFAP